MPEAVKITVSDNTINDKKIKIAFATKDMEHVNAHFGGAKEFVVYNLDGDGYTLDGVIKADTSNLNGDDKTDFKVKALEGINIVYCESIGGTAAAKVIRAGLNPMKIKEVDKIEDLLKELVQMINSNPPPWVKKIMNIPTQEDPRLDRWKIEE